MLDVWYVLLVWGTGDVAHQVGGTRGSAVEAWPRSPADWILVVRWVGCGGDRNIGWGRGLVGEGQEGGRVMLLVEEGWSWSHRAQRSGAIMRHSGALRERWTDS